MVRETVRGDVHVVQEELASVDPAETVLKARLAGAQRFDFRSPELNAGLVGFQDVVVVTRFSVRDRRRGRRGFLVFHQSGGAVLTVDWAGLEPAILSEYGPEPYA